MTDTDQSRPLLGVALMAASMLLVPNVDAIAKLLTAHHHPLFISWSRYTAACLFVVPWAISRRGFGFLPRENLGAQILRTVFAVAAMCLFFVAISLAPLADVTSAYFVGPIVAAVLSVVVLGERLTPARIAALALGFAGALIIVKPGGSLNPGLLLGVASGVCFGLYVVASRAAASTAGPVQTLAFQCLFGALIMSPFVVLYGSWPGRDEWLLFLGMGAISGLCHFLAISAFRHAEASMLAPLTYLELVSAVTFGYLLFGDWPSLRVWLGAALIVAAGLTLMLRKPAKTASTTAPTTSSNTKVAEPLH